MSKPYIIGITGGSGSGKTTFINRISSEFSLQELCIISQDDYYKSIDKQKKDVNGVPNFDMPRSIYRKAFYEDICKLINGEVVSRPEYTFNNKGVKPKLLTFNPAPILIVEGLFIFHYRKIKRLLDLSIFFHAKENLKVIRRIKRDKVERNYPLDDVLYRYQEHVLPTFEKYIKPYQEEADVVINNNDDFEGGLEVILGFLQNKIQQTGSNQK